MANRHDWNSWDQYRAIHDRILEQYASYFLEKDELRVDVAEEVVSWEGVLYCLGGIEIHVRKQQATRFRNGRLEVRTETYSYHVLRRVGSGAANLFRYDNIHLHPNHPDAHHFHAYDENGEPVLPIMHVGVENWPTLGEVLEEARKWWLSHSVTS